MNLCPSIIEDKESGEFCSCDLEQGHEGHHRGLAMEWDGGEKVIADHADWMRAKAIMTFYIHQIAKEHTEKK